VARLVVRGEFGPLLGEALPECEIAALSGETHVTARVRDEAEMFGLIERLRNLGASLVSASLDPQCPPAHPNRILPERFRGRRGARVTHGPRPAR
jgi:hypothetical protein